MALCVSYRTKKYLKKTGWSIPLEMLSRNCALSQSRWPDSCYLVIIDEDLTVFKASKLIYETIHFTNSLVFIDLFSIYLKGWEEEWGILIEFPSTGSLSKYPKAGVDNAIKSLEDTQSLGQGLHLPGCWVSWKQIWDLVPFTLIRNLSVFIAVPNACLDALFTLNWLWWWWWFVFALT